MNNNFFSFTQNLSAVLLDPVRFRAEVSTFFTRHWGDSFIPRTSISSTQHVPHVPLDCFQQYLATTAKVFFSSNLRVKIKIQKHRQYLKARKALRSVALGRDSAKIRLDPDEVPSVLFKY